jgi:hypothetical protein
MNPSSWAGVIGAIGSCLTAVALIITARADSRRSRRLEGKVDSVQAIGETTHVIVNHQRDVMIQEAKDNKDYQRALIRALEARGIEVPVDQSVQAVNQDGL